MNTIHSERASDEAIHNLCALHGFKAYRTTVNELSGWHVTTKRSRSRAFGMHEDEPLAEWVRWVEYYARLWSI